MTTEQSDPEPQQEVLTPDEAKSERISNYAGLQVQSADIGGLANCIILYGAAGSGKTTVAASAADDERSSPVVYLDAEGGTKVVRHKPDIDVIQVRRKDDIVKFMKQLQVDDKIPWKTIVIDNLSEIAGIFKRSVVGAIETPTQPQWGRINSEVLDMVRTFRDLASLKNINVIIIAWDDPVQDDMKRVKNNLKFTPGLQKELPGIVDIVGFITKPDGNVANDVRLLDFTFNPKKTQAKMRRSALDKAMTIPEQFTFTLQNLPMGDILACLRGEQDWPSAKYTQKSN